MDKTKRGQAAQRLMADATFKEALATVLFQFNEDLLRATSTEDREAAWHAYHACKRVTSVLANWSQDADKA